MKKLLEKYKEISLLGNVSGLVGWDTEVNMPIKAATGRGEQSALLAGLIVDRWQDKEFKKLLGEANLKKDLSLKEKAILRNLNRSAKIYHKIPKKLLVEESKLTSKAFVAWATARKQNDFSEFSPHLTKLVKLSREIIKYLEYKDNPYDAFLDLYEPNLTADFVKKMFDKLTPQLSQVIKKVDSKKPVKFKYPIDEQRALSKFIVERMGYDFGAGRMDIAPHPFEITIGRMDVRITNRYGENTLEGLTGAMHEGGHALYEQGVNENYEYTPLDHGVSLGIHESQSRFWENIVGRSREFSEFISPRIKILKEDQIFNVLNNVTPSFIRVDADEVTYNLHIAVRFEIENDLINGNIQVKDLPSVWNQKIKEYLGIKVKKDSEGVLQDVHWSHNSFGYFPTYTLGNLYSAQWFHYMKKDILNFKKLVRVGDFKLILNWLRKNIHQHGSLYYPDELVKKVTGEELNPDYFLEYIKEKYLK